MKVGIIAPIKFLEEYCVTDVQYCLPEPIIASEEYRRFYLEKGPNRKLILDCRHIGWKREPSNFVTAERAIECVIPDVVILPSYMYDATRTLEVAQRFNREIGRFHPATYVICPEGTTKKEVVKCANALQDKVGIHGFAVPSHQYGLVDMGEVHSDATVIFIDNHEHIRELSEQVAGDGILVTSLPVRLGLQGRLLSDFRPTPPHLTLYEKKDPYPMITKQNVEETIGFYKGGE